MSIEKKQRIAEMIYWFDPYGDPDYDINDVSENMPDDVEIVINELTDYYINGELTEPDDPEWLVLINGIRAIERS